MSQTTPEKKRTRHAEAKRQMLKSIALLPSLFTILNALAGFAAIHFATKDSLGQAETHNLFVASWLVLVAMACDMLDGRLARMTRKTSDFGGQLDSLSDIISFGVAPAMIMVRTVITALRLETMDFLPAMMSIERTVWCIAAVYVACAGLRLARFNVENEPDESSHMDFRGLPTPGAAAAIVTLVLLLCELTNKFQDWHSIRWLLIAVSTMLPLVTLLTALLMVSRFEYLHIINQYIRGKRPFNYLVKMMLVLIGLLLVGRPYLTGSIIAVGYAFSGPIRSWFKFFHKRRSIKDVEKKQAI